MSYIYLEINYKYLITDELFLYIVDNEPVCYYGIYTIITDRLKNMKNKEYLKEFDSIASSNLKHNKQKVYTTAQIRQVVTTIKKEIKYPKSVSVSKMIEILESSHNIEKAELLFPSRKYTLYIRGKASIFEIVSSLDGNAYCSHLSALYFHGLLEDGTYNDIYMNIEQSQKPKYENIMIQENIDKAFSRPPRITSNVVNYQQWRIFLINGKHTNKMGVINMTGPQKKKILVTDLERTLIDIAVRPNYSGGVSNVLNVYKKAIKKMSVDKMARMLKKLNYTYPYHQSIGFYLEKAGFPEGSHIFNKSFPVKFKFYLANQMNETEYSEKWNIFYPKDLLKTVCL
jgi:hypothetical protein